MTTLSTELISGHLFFLSVHLGYFPLQRGYRLRYKICRRGLAQEGWPAASRTSSLWECKRCEFSKKIVACFDRNVPSTIRKC